jgi:hypothetical protein
MTRWLEPGFIQRTKVANSLWPIGTLRVLVSIASILKTWAGTSEQAPLCPRLPVVGMGRVAPGLSRKRRSAKRLWPINRCLIPPLGTPLKSKTSANELITPTLLWTGITLFYVPSQHSHWVATELTDEFGAQSRFWLMREGEGEGREGEGRDRCVALGLPHWFSHRVGY